MPRFWKKKGQAIKKWRSRAWSIDPRITKLTIIKVEAQTNVPAEKREAVFSNLKGPNPSFPACSLHLVALTDLEQTGEIALCGYL